MNEEISENKNLEGSITEVVDPIKKAFDLRNRMARVYANKNGGFVYVAFRRDGTSKKSNLILLIEYPDGQCSEIIWIPQDSIFDKSDGITPHKVTANVWIRNARNLEVLRKYCTPEMDIDYVKIYCTLRKNFAQIPVIEIGERYTIFEVYERIREHVIAMRDGSNIYSKCEDYPLISEDFEAIAEEAGYEPNELLNLMALHDILIVDGGKKVRFQKSIRPVAGAKPKRYYVFKNETKIKDMVEQRDDIIKIIAEETRPKVTIGAIRKW